MLYHNAESQLDDLAQADRQLTNKPRGKRIMMRITQDSCVSVDGVKIADSHLTRKEISLLAAIGSRESVVTKEQLFNELYAGIDEPELKIIDVFTCKLRKKLGDHGKAILTVWGRGYQFDPDYQFIPDAGSAGIVVAASVRELLDTVASEMDPPRKPNELASELLEAALKVQRAKLWA